MWLFEKGILTSADTGGIDIRWGDAETVLKLLRMIAYRQGFGEILGQGTRKMARRIGKDAEYWSKTIKGAETISDTRYSYPLALGEGVSPRGACHLKGLNLAVGYAVNPMSSSYLSPEFVDELARAYECPYPMVPGDLRWVPYGTRYLVRLMSTLDNIGVCAFNSHFILYHALLLDDLVPAIEAATGLGLDRDQVIACADRARILQRSFNHRLGLARRDDIPKDYSFEHPLKVVVGDKAVSLVLDRDRYNEALTSFYSMSGYDPDTGIPTRETLDRLGLSEVARDLAKQGITVA